MTTCINIILFDKAEKAIEINQQLFHANINWSDICIKTSLIHIL